MAQKIREFERLGLAYRGASADFESHSGHLDTIHRHVEPAGETRTCHLSRGGIGRYPIGAIRPSCRLVAGWGLPQE
jgi:hypothetical protein